MRTIRFPLPIRSLVRPARLGRRQRLGTTTGSATDACARVEQSNRAVAQSVRMVWLDGPLFTHPRGQPFAATERHAA